LRGQIDPSIAAPLAIATGNRADFQLVEAIRRACETAADPRGSVARGCFVTPVSEV
jgi:hypothetical protein